MLQRVGQGAAPPARPPARRFTAPAAPALVGERLARARPACQGALTGEVEAERGAVDAGRVVGERGLYGHDHLIAGLRARHAGHRGAVNQVVDEADAGARLAGAGQLHRGPGRCADGRVVARDDGGRGAALCRCGAGGRVVGGCVGLLTRRPALVGWMCCRARRAPSQCLRVPLCGCLCACGSCGLRSRVQTGRRPQRASARSSKGQRARVRARGAHS